MCSSDLDKVRQGMMGDLPMTADDIAAIMNGGGDALLSGIQKALQDRGDKLHREAMTPIEQYNEKMDELDKLKQARVLSMEDWTRLEEKFWKEANAGVDDHIDKLDDLDKKQREVFGEPNPFNPSNMVQDASWLNDLYSYNMPPGGFVGGVMPMNFRVFDSPAMAAANGGRQVYDWNSLASQGFDPTENPQLDEANKYLRQIVDNTADMGVYA